MKFLFDENVHRGLLSFLTELGHEVKLCPKSIENGEVFNLASSEQRVLITRDRHFVEDRFISSEHFGIWLLRVPAKELELQKEAISKVLAQYPSEELKDKVIKIVSSEDFEIL